MGGQVLLGDPVLALPGLAVDDRNPVGGAPRLDPAGEPASHPHEVRVIELVIAAVVQPPPPAPEPARPAAERKVRLQDNPVHAVVAAAEKIAVPLGEVIGHPPTLRISGASRQPDCSPQPDCPKGHSFRAKSRTERSDPLGR